MVHMIDDKTRVKLKKANMIFFVCLSTQKKIALLSSYKNKDVKK